MRYRTFGKTGVQVSEIGFGAWGIGGSWWGKAVDDRASVQALRRALDLGINFFDTALVYGRGHSERLIGQVLAETRAPASVASKVPPKDGRWPALPAIPAKEAFPGDWIVSCTEQSLKNLGVERLDLIQFHVWSDAWMTQQEVWRPAVERLKQDGKIRFWGVSINDLQPDSALQLVDSGFADSVQVIYNIFEQAPADKLFPLCQKKGVAVIVRVPFDEGSLTGAFTLDTVFDDQDFRKDYFGGGRLAQAVRRVEALRPLFQEQGMSVAQGALRFCLSHPAVSTVIPGMRKPAHVEENVRAAESPPLPPDFRGHLKKHAWPRG
jgi:aryl-alcohol dehydrogenase-like predicted oxidoreductase